MQISEFRDLLANDGFAATFQTMGQYRTELLRALDGLRAQADARPVAYQRRMRAYEREEWSDWHDVHEGVALDCEKTPTLNGWVYEIRRLYTHPAEASAPGLSDEDTLSVAAALESARVFIKNGVALGYIRMPDADCPDPAHGTLPLIERAMRILTRASAATVGEASAAPKPHVGESSFEGWYQDYAARLTGNPKQTARDAYAAGMGDPLVVPCDAVRHAGTPHKFEISEEWLSKRLAIADDADCAAGQSAPKRPCDAPPGCNGNNCLGCGEQQAEPSDKLDAPAQVGNTVFGKGVKTRLVIEAAQRNHQRTHNPTEEDKRITAATESIARLRKQIEQEHDAKSPFQREVERLAKPQAEPGADERSQQLAVFLNLADVVQQDAKKTRDRYPAQSERADQLAAFMKTACKWAAQSGQRAGVAEGWQLVPKEPTHAMHLAGETQWENSGNASPEISAIYRAMLAAAPTQQQEGGDV